MTAYGNYGRAKGYDADAEILKFRAVKFGVSAESVAPINSAGSTGVGVSQFDCLTAEILQGKGVSVLEEGITEWECGADVDRGAQVTVDNVGRCVEAAGADFIWGVARQTGAVGDRIAVTLDGAFSVSAIVT
jgi:hypothetical protein